MSIEWVPLLSSPMHRRLELLAVSFTMFSILAGGSVSLLLIAVLLYYGNIYVRAVTILYLTFVFYDRNTGDQGGRGAGSQWVRNWRIFKHYNNYFPLDLIKTVDLPVDRNYLIALFPHGVVSNGALGNFCHNSSKWAKLFPGIRSKCTTLGFHMITPILRELILSYGMCSASANSLTTVLLQSNDPKDKSNDDGCTSNAAVLMVGGAQEAYYAYPYSYKCVIKNRKGFVRLAIKTGASLVPALSFGETNIYDLVSNDPGSLLRRFQDTCKRYTKVAPIIFNGRGLLQYNYGLLPRRHPITTVIGAPIAMTKNPSPTEDEVNAAHLEFCERLKKLFETHKANYIENHENVQLEII